MTAATPIKRALLSVSDKTGLVPLAQFLAGKGIELLSTGGTAKALRAAGLTVTDVSDVTGFPEIMDGRVKTLHPNVHGGILAKRDDKSHLEAMQEHGIEGIDLVVLNLYPFEETVKAGKKYSECVEQIDIGGPAMLRASAKNHAHVGIVTDPEDYKSVIEALENHGGLPEALRRKLALKAFSLTASYDSAIFHWLASELGEEFPERESIGGGLKQVLRYGENPHQHAALYVSDPKPGTLAGAEQLQGKELSYNNLQDTDAAWELACEFELPAVALIKHANPCGVALGKNNVDAFEKALKCDPKSAFGGILATNRPVDVDLVEALGSLFLEVLIAPMITKKAREALAKKKNLRVLETGALFPKEAGSMVKTISGGMLMQTADRKGIDAGQLKIASKAKPSHDQLEDMLFAFRVCKHVKSNAIVLAKDGTTIGIGAGQMSRVDSVMLAGNKAEQVSLDTKGCVLASDAFFPFDDNVHHAAELGVSAIIQPGGSIRDEEVISAADGKNMAMVFTGQRHFRH